MSYILIPQIVTDKTAMIWVGAVDESVRTVSVRLEYSETNLPDKVEIVNLSSSEWRTWKTRHPLEKFEETSTIKALHYQRVTIPLKNPHTKYTVNLLIDNPDSASDASEKGSFEDYSKTIDKEVSVPVEIDPTGNLTKATVTSLPSSIPVKPGRPFTIMLGSCFYLINDPNGLVGQTFINLPEDSRPDIKFLCGDQVYLDNPWKETTWKVALAFSPKENMRAFFFEKYLKTWTQINRVKVQNEKGEIKEKAIGGFNLLLRNGANYFCSDDHEFWNNAPNFGGVGAALTVLRQQKRWWFREASELFRVFQSLAPWMTFDVSPVSFCIADTRINRTTHNVLREDDQATFMEPDDLKAVGAWIKNLKGPGILVLGQLLMTEKADWKKTYANLRNASFFTRIKESFGDYFDFGLPDFPSQYKELCGYIKNSTHSIVLLTGDVHFGRMAICNLDEKGEVQFVEIISSPMSVVMVDEKHSGIGTYEPATEIFGTEAENIPIALNDDEKPVSQNHFTTLEFSRKSETDTEVEMRVKAWKIVTEIGNPNDPNKPTPIEVKTITLK